MDTVEEVLAHHGVKGMKWGVRNDKGHEGEKAKTKKIAKLDKKFEANVGSYQTTVTLHNYAADKANKLDVDRINNKPEYKAADFTRDSPLRQKYYKEHQDAYLNRLEEAATHMGTNASGTKKYRIVETQAGGWDVFVDDVKHADTPELSVTPQYKDGRLVSIPSKSVAHDSGIVGGFLEHYGVKGMKWGVRKSDSSSSGPTEAVATQKKPGTRLRTSGGEGHAAHPDAVKAATTKRKAHASTTDALSNNELRDLVKRLQLEQQFSQLAAPKQSVGKKFITKILGNTANQTAQQAANKVAQQKVDEFLKAKGYLK